MRKRYFFVFWWPARTVAVRFFSLFEDPGLPLVLKSQDQRYFCTLPSSSFAKSSSITSAECRGFIWPKQRKKWPQNANNLSVRGIMSRTVDDFFFSCPFRCFTKKLKCTWCCGGVITLVYRTNFKHHNILVDTLNYCQPSWDLRFA